MYDHEKIQRKMSKLENMDTDDDLRMPGGTTSYKSINYKSKGANKDTRGSEASSNTNYDSANYFV
jgi:hypothetical protein